MRYVRWISLAIASVAVLATALIVTGSGSAGASSVRRFSAGVLTVDGPSTLGILVSNHTSHTLHATVRLDNSAGFTSTGPVPLTIAPGGYMANGFTCTNSGSCYGEPIVITTVGALPSATYTMYTTSTTPNEINVSPGEWRTF